MPNQGYSTGISTQSLDFGSIATNYAQSAVEQKLYELKQNKAEVGSNAEKMLKALSITAIPELSGKVREDYNKKIEAYRADIINRFRSKEGKLGFEDQAAIERGAVDLTNEMNVKKNWLDKYAAVQKTLLNPTASKTYNVMGATADLSKAYKDFLDGNMADDPALIPFKHILPNDYTGAIVEDQRKNLPLMGKSSETSIAGGTQTTVEDVPFETRQARAVAYVNSDPMFQNLTPEQKQAEVQKALSSFNPQEVTTKPYVPKGKSGGSGSLAKRQEIYEMDAQDPFSGKPVKFVNFPPDLSRTPRPIIIGKAYDENGKLIDVNENKDVELVGFSKDTGLITVQTTGGQMNRNGSPLFSTADISGRSLTEKKDKGQTEQQLKNIATTSLPTLDNSQKWDDVKDVQIVKDESGDWVMKGTLVKKAKKGIFSDDAEITKEVSQPIYPVSDDKAQRVLYLPISDYKTILTPSEKKYKINGMSILDYAESAPSQSKESTQTKSAPNEVQRQTKDGKIAIFDATTKKFLRYAE